MNAHALLEVSPAASVAPRPSGAWERRLRKDVERALPYVQEAVQALARAWADLALLAAAGGASCGLCGRPWGHDIHQPFGECEGPLGRLLAELATPLPIFHEAVAASVAMVFRPADDPRRTLEAQHHRLLSVMSEEGLDLGLACSKLALPVTLIKTRMRDDPMFAEEIRRAEDRGTITLLETLVKAARGLPVSRVAVAAAQRLLECRDPKRFLPAQRVELSESAILGSRAFQEQVVPRLARAFAAEVPEVPTDMAEGGEEVAAAYRRGWAAAVAHLRRRAAEELEGG